MPLIYLTLLLPSNKPNHRQEVFMIFYLDPSNNYYKARHIVLDYIIISHHNTENEKYLYGEHLGSTACWHYNMCQHAKLDFERIKDWLK